MCPAPQFCDHDGTSHRRPSVASRPGDGAVSAVFSAALWSSAGSDTARLKPFPGQKWSCFDIGGPQRGDGENSPSILQGVLPSSHIHWLHLPTPLPPQPPNPRPRTAALWAVVVSKAGHRCSCPNTVLPSLGPGPAARPQIAVRNQETETGGPLELSGPCPCFSLGGPGHRKPLPRLQARRLGPLMASGWCWDWPSVGTGAEGFLEERTVRGRTSFLHRVRKLPSVLPLSLLLYLLHFQDTPGKSSARRVFHCEAEPLPSGAPPVLARGHLLLPGSAWTPWAPGETSGPQHTPSRAHVPKQGLRGSWGADGEGRSREKRPRRDRAWRLSP